ncbi:MAG TPA: hypothetical protein VNN80_01570 [Polyangiaceae bacterium]|jgi:hypothetical protein|nr:hypothetical protein [Polyangiaceae bacterium]
MIPVASAVTRSHRSPVGAGRGPPRGDIARHAALDELARDGLIAPVLATAASLGGWIVVESE